VSVPDTLRPWIAGGMAPGRTLGEIGLKANGGDVDIWIRVDGRPEWIAVPAQALRTFLEDAKSAYHLARVLAVESSIPPEKADAIDL